MLFIERNYFPMNKAGGPMTTQLTNPADVMPANGFEIACRLEAHAQAARGALADQTCRALASDSRIWSAWCTERNVSVLPAEPTTVVGSVVRRGRLRYGFDRPVQDGSGGRGSRALAVAEDGGGLTSLAGLRQDCQRPPVPCDPQERRGEAVAPRTRRDCPASEKHGH